MNTSPREASDRSRGTPGMAIKRRMRKEDGSKEAQQKQESRRHDRADTWTGPKSRKHGRADSFKPPELTGTKIPSEVTTM